MSGNDTVLCPAYECGLVDSQASCRFLFRQHASVSKSIVTRAKPVTMDEIGDSQGGETSITFPTSRRPAGAKSLLIEYVRDPGIDVVVEEFVDEFDDLRRRLHLLRGGLGVQRRERFGLAALEADVDPGGSFRRQFDQRDILNDVGEQSFALAVWRARIAPLRIPDRCSRGF